MRTTAADIDCVVTLVTLVVFAAKPLPVTAALKTGAVAIGGGLLQTLFSTFLWPIRRYEPERRIIGAIYHDLARIAKDPPSTAKAPPMTREISDARDALVPLARDHSAEAERHVFLLVQAERIRLSILNAGRLQRRLARNDGGKDAAAALDAILERASDVIALIGQRLLQSETVSVAAAINRLTAELVVFQRCCAPPDNAFYAALLRRDAKQQSVALRSQVRDPLRGRLPAIETPRTCKRNFAPSPGAGSISALPWRLRFEGYRARLVANLSLDSTVFSGARRAAGALLLAVGDTMGRVSVGLQRTYWIPMTIAIVLKPDFTGTFARGVLRIGGTMAGLVSRDTAFQVDSRRNRYGHRAHGDLHVVCCAGPGR